MIKLGQPWHGNEGKFALNNAGKCYFYMLKMQKVPIASRHRMLDTDFLFSKVGRYGVVCFI